ncbi:MAG: tyrosine-type recombinase/integrase [Desulfobacteraceae bacterium]|nr:tyrosine-type recombinase/integrase [Desulfobacteraceae bacterium]
MQVGVTVAEFKLHLKAKGYAAATIASYGKGLAQFRDYLQSRDMDDLRRVTAKVIEEYRSTVMAEPIAAESKALKIRPVKRLFEWLIKSHKLLINPCEGLVETCRTRRKIATVLTVDEVNALLKQPNLSLRTGIRDRAILELFYSTGIRLDELLGLEVYHIDLADGVLFIRKAKGGRQRAVPMGKTAAAYLKEYLEKIRPYYARKNPRQRRLFINHFGLAMSKGSIRQMMRTCRLGAGIKKPVSPHTLRRSCATHMLQNGADIRYIQKLLGHKELKTTQQYTKVVPVDLKKTHVATHPGNKKKKDEDH